MIQILLILSTLFATASNHNTMSSIYDIKINDINNRPLDLSKYKGKKMLIVNVASECGYTPQYKQLQELHEKYGNKVVIIGIPCNDFGGQEPGTTAEIQTFCEMTYGIKFQMTEKVGIKQNRHPLYNWLCDKKENGVSDNEVKWNFHKFLIDENGNLLKSLPSKITPLDESILDWVNS